MSTIIIFAGGDSLPITLIDELPDPDLTIAADSGHDIARSLGFAVDVLIGDFDSIEKDSPVSPDTEVIRHPADKDATDIELALEYSLRLQPERVVLVGGEGGRFDHEISLVSVLGSDRWGAIPEIDWFRTDANNYVIRGTRRIQGDPDGLISLIAIGGDALDVSTKGLAWELDRETLHSGSSRGTSNRFVRPEAVVTVGEGTLLAVVPVTGPD